MKKSKGEAAAIAAGTIIGLGIACKKGLLPAFTIPLPFGLKFSLCGMFNPPNPGPFGPVIFGNGNATAQDLKQFLSANNDNGSFIMGKDHIAPGKILPAHIYKIGTRLKVIRDCSVSGGDKLPIGAYGGTVIGYAFKADSNDMRYLVKNIPGTVKTPDYFDSWNWRCVQNADEIELK